MYLLHCGHIYADKFTADVCGVILLKEIKNYELYLKVKLSIVIIVLYIYTKTSCMMSMKVV